LATSKLQPSSIRRLGRIFLFSCTDFMYAGWRRLSLMQGRPVTDIQVWRKLKRAHLQMIHVGEIWIVTKEKNVGFF
jgi:hypothetical protein